MLTVIVNSGGDFISDQSCIGGINMTPTLKAIIEDKTIRHKLLLRNQTTAITILKYSQHVEQKINSSNVLNT